MTQGTKALAVAEGDPKLWAQLSCPACSDASQLTRGEDECLQGKEGPRGEERCPCWATRDGYDGHPKHWQAVGPEDAHNVPKKLRALGRPSASVASSQIIS